MSEVDGLADDHPWWHRKEWDRLVFRCGDCDVVVPCTASDTQAGIRLFCPECNNSMDYDDTWREDD